MAGARYIQWQRRRFLKKAAELEQSKCSSLGSWAQCFGALALQVDRKYGDLPSSSDYRFDILHTYHFDIHPK
jgi:hypothetical protein